MKDIADNTAIPEGLDVIPGIDGVTIRRRWFGWKYVSLAIFAAVWDSFLFFWYSMAFKSEDTPWMMIVFPLGHVAVGIGITYSAICGFLNRTDLRIGRRTVEVKTTPLPWFGNKRIESRDIARVLTRNRSSENGGTFNVLYVTRDNRERKLVTGLQHHEQAEYIKLQLEHILSLKRE